jgi:hypothetical protein
LTGSEIQNRHSFRETGTATPLRSSRSRSLLSLELDHFHLQQEAEERLLVLNSDIDHILDHLLPVVGNIHIAPAPSTVIEEQQRERAATAQVERVAEVDARSRSQQAPVSPPLSTATTATNANTIVVDTEEEQAQLAASSVWFAGIVPNNMRLQSFYNNLTNRNSRNTNSSNTAASSPPPSADQHESTSLLLSRSLLSSSSRPVRRRNASQRGAAAAATTSTTTNTMSPRIVEEDSSSSVTSIDFGNSSNGHDDVISSDRRRRRVSSIAATNTDYSTFSEFDRLTGAAEDSEAGLGGGGNSNINNTTNSSTGSDGGGEDENESHNGSSTDSNQGDAPTTAGSDNDNANNEAVEEEDEDWENILNTEDVTQLTTRLRCLFALLTCPIVPLAATLTLLLLWVLYSALLLDWGLPCDEPLRLYALLSAAMFAYTPHHRTVKRYLFGYWRERDGPARPWKVRVYDQAYHAACLLWMYAGISWTTHAETCSVTSPNLYKSTRVFVLVQTIFMSILVVPLLCLPCIYLWLVRQASVIATNRRARRRKRADPAKIMASFVQIDVLKEENQTLLEGKECCICMCDYTEELEELAISNATTTTGGGMSVQGAASQAFAADNRASSSGTGTGEGEGDNDKIIIQTQCGHLFHKSCIATWISTPYSGAYKCPLCREDLVPSEEGEGDADGEGEGNAATTTTGSNNNSSSNIGNSYSAAVEADEENQLPLPESEQAREENNEEELSSTTPQMGSENGEVGEESDIILHQQQQSLLAQST